jgi:hypothetical protein
VTEPVTARLVVEQVKPDADGRLPGEAGRFGPPPMWLRGDGVQLTLTAPGGAVLMSATLELATLKASLSEDGELIRFQYQPTEYPDA